MVKNKRFKQLVRSRMEKTGEAYVVARQNILRSTSSSAPRPLTLSDIVAGAQLLTNAIANAMTPVMQFVEGLRLHTQEWVEGRAREAGLSVPELLQRWRDQLVAVNEHIAYLQKTPTIRVSLPPVASFSKPTSRKRIGFHLDE